MNKKKMNTKTLKRIKKAEELLSQGYSIGAMGNALGVSYATAHKYKQTIEEANKEEVAIVQPEVVVQEEVVIKQSQVQSYPISSEEVEFKIGETSFGIRKYTFESEIMFDGEDVISAIELALNKTCLPKTKTLNSISLIDRGVLIDLSNELGDYCFKKSVQHNLFETSIFDGYRDIVSNLSMVEECFSTITEKYEVIKHYNNLQMDVIHEIEKCEADEEDALMCLTRKLKAIREQRREAKNQLTISNKIKNNLSALRINPKDLSKLKDEVLPLIAQLESKEYKPRAN